MISNAVRLRRAMQALDLTGVALAGLITSMREDNKVTAPETVSRWLTGANPVDPAVMGWTQELLRAKALATERSVVRWPSKGSLTIAISNLKGGVGKSTVAAALATIAHRDHKIQVKHFEVGAKNPGFANYLKAQDVESSYLTADEAIAYEPDDHELVILDVSYKSYLDDKYPDFMQTLNPDVLVVPADFGKGLDVAATRQFLEQFGHAGLTKLLHRPSRMQLDFAATAARAGFDVESKAFIPEFIPLAQDSRVFPSDWQSEWVDEDQHWHYLNLFEYLFGQVGGGIQTFRESFRGSNAWDFDTLLELMAPPKTKKGHREQCSR
jgi:hypothetical protein